MLIRSGSSGRSRGLPGRVGLGLVLWLHSGLAAALSYTLDLTEADERERYQHDVAQLLLGTNRV